MSIVFSRLREMFEQCVDMPEGERLRWLDQHVADPNQRIELELLLAADAKGDGFLRRDVISHIERFDDDADDEFEPQNLIGRRFGAFELQQLIGRGGQGTVYLAQRVDGDFAQTAAVKLLRRGIHDSIEHRRFRREREILARFEHAGVARLIDGGVSGEGVPYLVMEYVEGVPIDAWCDRHALHCTARLKLFAQLCDVVAAAQRALIVHRDLKPTNVLVTEAGDIKVLDFGIARLLDEDEGMQTQVPILTPGYCAPEQATGGTITFATDVHALGVLLRVLLTGVEPTPEHAADADQRLTQVPPELRWILAKACATDPEQRYRDAAALGEDIVRFLTARPIAAHPPSRWYATRKFVARHRGSVLGTALVLLGILASAGVALWQAKVAYEQAQRAEAARDFLLGVFDAAKQDLPREVRPTPEVLARAAAKKLHSDSRLPASLRAEFLGTLSEISSSSSDYAGAVAQAEQALAVLHEAGQERTRQALALSIRRANALVSLDRAAEADQDLGARLADIRAGADTTAVTGLAALSSTRFGTGNVDDAIALAHEAMDLAERVYGKDTQDALMLAANYGDLLVVAGHSREGAAALDAMLSRWRASGVAQDHTFANSLQNLAEAKYRLGDMAGSERAQQEALVLLRRIYTAPHEQIANALFSLGVPLMNAERNDEAEKVLLEAAAMYAQLFGPLHPQNAGMFDGLGSLELNRLNHAKAAEYFERATHICTEAKLDNNPDCARFWQNLSATYLRLDRIDDAAAANAHSLALRRKLFGEHHAAYASSLAGLASVQLARQQPEPALTTIDQALAIMAEHGQSESIMTTRMLIPRASALKQLRRFSEALDVLDRIVVLLDRLVPNDARNHLSALALRAETLEALGRIEQARAQARSVLKYERQRLLIAPERWQHLEMLAH